MIRKIGIRVCPKRSLRGAKRRSNLIISLVNKEIATLPMVARNDKRGFLDKLIRGNFMEFF